MIGPFDNLPVLKDDNIIRFFDGLEPMGDDDDRTSFKEVVECDVYFLFRETIECTRWFIEDNNLWIFDKNLRDCEALSLTSGESHSLLPYLSFDSIRELVDKFTLCEFNRLFELYFRHFGSGSVG